jgi:hypothetical protein
LLLPFQLDPAERELLPEKPRYFTLDFPFLFHVATWTIRLTRAASCEIDFPQRLVGIGVTVQQGSADILAEDTAILGRDVVFIERHLPLIYDIVVVHALAKVAFPVRTHAHNSWAISTMTPFLASFTEEIDSVAGQLVQSERPGNFWELMHLAVQPLAYH